MVKESHHEQGSSHGVRLWLGLARGEKTRSLLYIRTTYIYSGGLCNIYVGILPRGHFLRQGVSGDKEPNMAGKIGPQKLALCSE